jgi:hypothetical protein
MTVISFNNTNYAMMAEKCFGEEHFEKMVIPTPRAISNSCGISLMINDDDVEKAKKLIIDRELKIKGIFTIYENTAIQIF